jgi:hypothetical protein
MAHQGGNAIMIRKTLALCATLALAAACGVSSSTPRVDPVKRGAYLVATMGCNDCHTPLKLDPALGMPVPDRTRLLSGHPAGGPDPSATPGEHDMGVIGPTFTAFALPFGKVYARNLTPDPDTGMGGWTADEFVKTMRTGKWKGIGRPLLPPMPWLNLAAATDDDLRAIFADLQSLPAIKNQVPNAQVPDAVVAGMASTYEKITGAAKL